MNNEEFIPLDIIQRMRTEENVVNNTFSNESGMESSKNRSNSENESYSRNESKNKIKKRSLNNNLFNIPNKSKSLTLKDENSEETSKFDQTNLHNITRKSQSQLISKRNETPLVPFSPSLLEFSEDNENDNYRSYSNLRQSQTKKKHLEKKDLYNREKSKLACLIRKKYTALMKQSIKLKGTKERYVCCASLRKVTSKVIYQLTGTVFQAIISILAIIVYVVSTYYPDYSQIDDLDEPDKTIVSALKWTELTLAIVINLDFIYNLFTNKQRMKYICNFLNILDIIIVLSIYLNFMIPNMRSLAFIRVFRVIRIMRVFRFYKLIDSRKKEFQEENKNEITRRLVSAILTVLAVVFLATGVVHFLNGNFPEYFKIVIPSLETMVCQSGKDFTINTLEPSRKGINLTLQCEEGDTLIKKPGELTFDLAFYYMVITMATVGYGDIYPDTSWMRLVIGIFVIISIITITKQTSELNDLIKLNSEYQVAFEEHKSGKHCVLSGFFSKSSLIKFLNEFYHSDHKEGSENTKIVIIQSDYPDKEIQSILMNPKFEENLHYLIGDIFSENTLHMAKVENASGIFLISDQNHPDAMKNDQFLILACKAMSQYSQAHLYVQFNFSQSLLHDWADWDIACSSQQIKMSIIVKNGFVSGFSTMIMNLASSSSSIYNSEIQEIPWMLEYIHGASQEIYIIKIPVDYEKKTKFSKFAEKSYLSHGSLVIGVKKKVYYQKDKDIFYFIFLLNPIDYELNEEDELIVISSDQDAAKAIFTDVKKSKPIKKLRDEEIETENEKLSKNLNMEFYTYFKLESETVGAKENIQELEHGVPFKSSKIPEIFHKRQYFKIWENNPYELHHELKDHYLIFCKEEHLWEFMNCFDQHYSDIIFFISDQHPSPKWDILRRYFKNLVYIECSYSDQEDLVKLNLEKAKHAFILTYAVENSNVNDSGILPLVNIIEENFPKCKYTLELSDELNVRYFNHKGIDQEGRTLVEKQLNFNNLEKEEINKKKEKKKHKKAQRLPVRLWPKYAKSDIFFASSLESILAFSYHNEGVLDVLTKLLGFNNNVIKDKNVVENDILSMYRYIGTRKVSYDKLFKNFFLLSPPVIPIAIYRTRSDRELKNESPYIITNPKKDLELNQFDQVICLGRPQDKIFEIYKEEDYLEEDSNYSFEDSADISSERENKLNKNKFTSNFLPKRSMVDDLERLDEDQLLERLKNEIRNLKKLTKSDSSNLNLISPQLSTDSKLKNLLNFNLSNKKSNFNIIEEKIDEADEIKQTNSERKDDDKSQISDDSLNIINKDSKEDVNSSINFVNKFSNHSSQSTIKNKNSDQINNELSLKSNNQLSESDSESSSLKGRKKKRTKKIINNNNYNIKIKSNNQFQGNNTINISQQPTFQKLSISAVERFNIIKDDLEE